MIVSEQQINALLDAARAEGVAALQQPGEVRKVACDHCQRMTVVPPAEPVADILVGLDMIRRQADYWVSYNTEARTREGLASNDDTHLISPPSWPSHGQLKAWSEVLAKAAEALYALPQQPALVEGVKE